MNSQSQLNPQDRIIVALDYPTLSEAQALVERLADKVGYFKVGLELLMADGPAQAVKLIHSAGGKVFLDGKFSDIPNTVGAASSVVTGLGVDMFNVHANCGVASMSAAVANKGEAIVLAVTVLTSITDEETKSIYQRPAVDQVLEFAKLAKSAGIDGLVCSPMELTALRANPELSDLLLVTPGVRPAWAAVGDQKRVMTPSEAVAAGADYLVIGRPITQPPAEVGSPEKAVELIIAELTELAS